MIRQYINIIMGILYAFIGGFVIWKKFFIVELDPVAAIAMGILLIVYGIFRLYRAIVELRS